MENTMTLWKKYADPPAEAKKAFNNGTFSGTDISPMWRIACLTEEFGPCGIGWYAEIAEHWTDEVEGIMTAHVRINLFIKQDGEWSKPISAVGGNSFVRKAGGKVSDEAYKMAYTDAIGGACKMLGIGGAVYWEAGYSKYESDYVDEPTKTAKKTTKKAEAKPASSTLAPEDIEAAAEEGQFRAKAVQMYGIKGLDAACMRKFGTSFNDTPIDKLKTVLKF